MRARLTRRLLVLLGVLGIAAATAAPALALPPIGQPGNMRDPRDPATQPATIDPVAARNFGDGTPGEAITGGVFNGYGIPGFFPFGNGEPGSGTGGWVSGIAHG